jgi:hypothetical protein
MARLLYIPAPHRHLRCEPYHTRYTTAQAGCRSRARSRTTGRSGPVWRRQLLHASEEGSQVLQRPVEPLPNDCTSNATRAGEAVQGVWQGA